MLWRPLANMKQNDTSPSFFFIHRKEIDILSCMHACCATVEFEWLSDPRPPAKRLQASNLIHATQKKKAVLRKNPVSYPYLEVSVCFFFCPTQGPQSPCEPYKAIGQIMGTPMAASTRSVLANYKLQSYSYDQQNVTFSSKSSSRAMRNPPLAILPRVPRAGSRHTGFVPVPVDRARYRTVVARCYAQRLKCSLFFPSLL